MVDSTQEKAACSLTYNEDPILQVCFSKSATTFKGVVTTSGDRTISWVDLTMSISRYDDDTSKRAKTARD
jgi:hypothetical protein